MKYLKLVLLRKIDLSCMSFSSTSLDIVQTVKVMEAGSEELREFRSIK